MGVLELQNATTKTLVKRSNISLKISPNISPNIFTRRSKKDWVEIRAEGWTVSRHFDPKKTQDNHYRFRAKEKQSQLIELITEHNPDIICGTEFHLDEKYKTNEVFPEAYTITRKDRKEGVGEVFTAVSKR